MIREAELAWNAGFFDGEGTTYVHRQNTRARVNKSLRLELTQCNRKLLERFKRFARMGSICGPYQAHGLGTKAIYKYGINGPSALTFIREFWPFLGPEKREQARLAIKEYREYLAIPHLKSGPKRRLTNA